MVAKVGCDKIVYSTTLGTHNFLILGVLMKKRCYSAAFNHFFFFFFFFFKNNFSLTKFSTSSVCACEQLDAPH